MVKGFVISDLHLFRPETDPGKMLNRLVEVGGGADFLVLNGDIFDFRWTALPTANDTEKAALRWFQSLASRIPQTMIFYLFGNNDCHKGFAEFLRQETIGIRNFKWFSSLLRLGHALFLHGDVPLFSPWKDPSQRSLRTYIRKTNPIVKKFVRGFMQPVIMPIASKVFSPKRCAMRIRYAIKSHPGPFFDGVTDVYFGHIHTPFANYRYKGLNFHNTGCTLPEFLSECMEVHVNSMEYSGT